MTTMKTTMITTTVLVKETTTTPVVLTEIFLRRLCFPFPSSFHKIGIVMTSFKTYVPFYKLSSEKKRE